MEQTYLFDKHEIFAPKKVCVEIENIGSIWLDHCLGGHVEAERKDFYFVGKKCKQPAKAFVCFDDMKPLADVSFWYENEQTLLDDLRYQMYWHTAIAHYPRSFGYKPHNDMYLQKIVEFFRDNLCVNISRKKADNYIGFLLENGFKDCAEITIKDGRDVLDAFMDYDNGNADNIEIILNVKQPYEKGFSIGKWNFYG